VENPRARRAKRVIWVITVGAGREQGGVPDGARIIPAQLAHPARGVAHVGAARRQSCHQHDVETGQGEGRATVIAGGAEEMLEWLGAAGGSWRAAIAFGRAEAG